MLKLRTDSTLILVEVELFHEHQGTLDPGADRSDGHRGAGNIDDIFVNADWILGGLAFVLRIEAFSPNFAAFALTVYHDLDVKDLTLGCDADDISDRPMFPDRFLDYGVAVDLPVGLRLKGSEGHFWESPSYTVLYP